MIQFVRSLMGLRHRPWADAEYALQTFHYRLRVMPWDIDMNLHLTNARYPQWLDIVRTNFFMRIGTGPLFLRGGWRSVLASQTITFIREIKPWALVDIESRVLHWDKKYFYMEHRFLVNGRMHAKALARIAVIKRGSVRSLGCMLQAVARYKKSGADLPAAPTAPNQVLAKIELLGAKRLAEEERAERHEAAGRL